MYDTYLIIVCALIAVLVGLRLRGVLGLRGRIVSKPLPVPQPPVKMMIEGQDRHSGFDKDIQTLQTKIPDFSLPAFVEGAKSAFSLVLKAFSEGDLVILRKLLGDLVYDLFAKAIAKRKTAFETLENTLEDLTKIEVVDLKIENEIAMVTVRFHSSQTHVLKDVDGSLIEGDPHKINRFIDEWVFQRPLAPSDPSLACWVITKLSSTTV